MTNGQLKRIVRDFKRYAKEEVNVEKIGGAVYAFGSEVATLRILKVYRFTENARQGFSENMNTYYFSLTF